MFSKKSRVRLRASMAALALLGFSSGLGAPAIGAIPKGAELSEVGEQALVDVTTCLTSGKSPVLDVYYLIDNSGSQEYTDPTNTRQKILMSSVGQLQNFIDQGINVNFAKSLFASNVSASSGWKKLSSASDVARASDSIRDTVSNTQLGGNTDWEEGLRAAYASFSQRPVHTCKMLIWLTDGGINPTGNASDTLASLKALCHPAISSSSLANPKEKFGLFNRIRGLEVSIFGILYQNDASSLKRFTANYDDDEEQNYPGEQRLDFEHYLMSYMIPLVEGKGSIPKDFIASELGLPPGGELQCSELGADGKAPAGLPNGAFLNAKDPVGLSFQFLKLQNVIGGGNGSVIQNGQFNVPTGTAWFRVITGSKNWKLRGPADSKISISSSSTPNSKIVTTTNSAGVTQIEVKTRDTQAFLGDWEFTAPDYKSEVYLFSGLTLSLDRDVTSKIIKDRPNTLTGQVVRMAGFEDLPVDLARFETHSLTLRAVGADGVVEEVPDVKVSITDSGQFKIENYSPEGSSANTATLSIALDLGNKFQVVISEFDLSLVDAAAFPVPKSDSVIMSDLIGPKGVSTGTLEVVGPTVNSKSKFCLDASPVRTSDSQTSSQKVDRMSGFDWKFDGKDSMSGYCVEVAKGETKKIEVQATNKMQANSHVVQIRGYVSSVDSSQLGGQTLQFEFNSQAEVDQVAKWLSVAFLLLLGILGPLLALYGFNKLTTKFLPTSGLVRADYPVEIRPGPSTRISDGRPNSKGSPIVVQPNEFKPIASNPKGEKHLPLGVAGNAKAVVKFWPPLTAPWFELVAPAGARVISVFRGSTKNPALFESGNTQEISPNMAENWVLVIPETELSKPPTENLNGTLVVLAAMAPQLVQYQNKISSIATNPSVGRTLASIRDSLAKEREKASDVQGKGKRGGAASSATPATKLNGSKPPPGPNATQVSGPSTGSIGAPPGSAGAKSVMPSPPSTTDTSGGLTPPPTTGGSGGGLKPPPGSNT